MGDGLVRTVDNLGTTGEMPSHPELLDYLASDLIEHEWSLKRLVRDIVLSDAYRRSSQSIAASESVDPDNRWCWRGHRRRLDAESIRDSILSISGELRMDMYGRRIPDGLKSDYGYQHTDPCRSIYVPALRNAMPDIFEVFDMADPSSVVGKRNRSTIASQALWMMNHPWMNEHSKKTAERLLTYTSDPPIFLEQASLRILGRRLTLAESNAFDAFIQSANQSRSKNSLEVDLAAKIVQTLFQSLDFRFLE